MGSAIDLAESALKPMDIQELINGNLHLYQFLESTPSRVNLFLETGFLQRARYHIFVDTEIALF